MKLFMRKVSIFYYYENINGFTILCNIIRAEILFNVNFCSNPGSVMLWQCSQIQAHFEDFISNRWH